MKNIVFDIGNSFCKVGVFDGDQMIETASELFSADWIYTWMQNHPDATGIWSSVAKIDEKTDARFKAHGYRNVMDLDNYPVSSLYKTPETLGSDRWAAVCGGAMLASCNEPFLVVQMGTALTFDLVDGNRQYLGGAISPGLEMRFHALHNFTARLPLLVPENNPSLIGSSTKESITSGVMYGALAEINYRIDEFCKTNHRGLVFIGGGDSRYFDLSGKNNIFAVPNIVLIGLNHLLNLNS